MINYVKPIIESRNEALKAVPIPRLKQAEAICEYLENGGDSLPFYEACAQLLEKDESRRIVLYFPLQYLRNAPEFFRKAYMQAWYKMLDIRDVRENFHIGDCFELDARPPEGLARVAKCAHLTPWLLRDDYLTVDQLVCILSDYADDEVLLTSFKDTWRFLHTRGVVNEEQIQKLESMTKDIETKPRQKPLYVSEKRKNWLLSMRKRLSNVLVTPNAKLQGPFSPNIKEIEPSLKKIADSLNPYEIVLVGGSQIKGYGTLESDLDVWPISELDKKSKNAVDSTPRFAHIFMDSIWLAGEKIPNDKLQLIANSYLVHYEKTERDDKMRCLERLESDLCQYRLLHKGYALFNDIKKFEVMSMYPEMNGDCAFYDLGYRKIATMLFAKYVWL